MEPLHPPYNQVQPRVLNRWLDVNSQNGPLTRSRYQIVVPAFNLTSNGLVTYSWIIGAFDYASSNTFSLVSLAGLVQNKNNPFSVCISYTKSNNSVVRYMLLKGPGCVIYSNPPAYTNQLIKPIFRIEIWSDTTAALKSISLSQMIALTSIMTNVDYRYSDDSPLANPSAVKTNFYTPNLNLPFVFPSAPTLNS